jgi:predicted GNAT superfamily acetyltransferase
MTTSAIRDAVATDFASIVGLNEVEVRQTSPMALDKLRLLDRLSNYHKVATVRGQVAAFLLAIGDGAPYRNDNYGWFVDRLTNFLYVDRIVVGVDFAGLGIGSQLYRDLFGYARSRGIQHIACEYNVEPPNPASRAFHDKFGFHELGTQWVAAGTKRVSLQVATI